MYYKVEKGSELFEKIWDFWEDVILVRQQAQKIANELGFSTWCGSSNINVIAGGITAFECLNKIPKNFKWYDKSQNMICLRKTKANKEILDVIKALPVIYAKRMQDLVKYTPEYSDIFYTKSRTYKLTPINDNIYIIKFRDSDEYQPIDGMVEILYSEYKTLMKQNDYENNK